MEKLKQKRDYDKRHHRKFADFKVGDSILVRARLPPNNKKYAGPFEVVKVDSFEGVPKRFFYSFPRKGIAGNP